MTVDNLPLEEFDHLPGLRTKRLQIDSPHRRGHRHLTLLMNEGQMSPRKGLHRRHADPPTPPVARRDPFQLGIERLTLLDLDVFEACRAIGAVRVREEIEGLESLLTQPLLFLSGKAEREKLAIIDVQEEAQQSE